MLPLTVLVSNGHEFSSCYLFYLTLSCVCLRYVLQRFVIFNCAVAIVERCHRRLMMVRLSCIILFGEYMHVT